MREFLVIEQADGIPRWLTRMVGRYLPSITVWQGELFGVRGKRIVLADIESEEGQKRLFARMICAQKEGIVCTVDNATNHAVQIDAGMICYDGTMLSAVLQAEDLLEKIDCSRCRILLRGADSRIGQALAVYLARRVRFLSIAGERSSVQRLASRLWNQEGIAVAVDAQDAELVFETMRYGCVMLAGGSTIDSAMAECALVATMTDPGNPCITVGMLERIATLVRQHHIILAGESADEKEIRLTNKQSKHII